VEKKIGPNIFHKREGCAEKGRVLRRKGRWKREGAGQRRAQKREGCHRGEVTGKGGQCCLVKVFTGRAHKKLIMCMSVLRKQMLFSKLSPWQYA
jgi:hypothetical protein